MKWSEGDWVEIFDDKDFPRLNGMKGQIVATEYHGELGGYIFIPAVSEFNGRTFYNVIAHNYGPRASSMLKTKLWMRGDRHRVPIEAIRPIQD